MSSALKPVLSAGGPQNPTVPTQLNKPMHPQGPAAGFGQPPSHMPQNLVNVPHNTPNPLHNPVNVHHSNVLGTQNHYSLNVPNAGQHYAVAGNVPTSSHSLPISSSLPVPTLNQAHTQSMSYNTNPPKNPSYPPNYQPNLGHPPNVPPQNMSVAPPQQAATPSESQDKPQSNGTQELKSNKLEQNHISPAKDRVTPQSPEKPKLSPEKPPTPVPSLSEDSSNEAKQPEQHSVDTPDTCMSDPATPTDSLVPENLMNTASSTSSIENKSEDHDVSTVESSNIVESTEKENHSNVEESKTDTTTTGSESVPIKSKEQATPKSTMKLATTPRTPSRKIKTPKVDQFSDSPKSSKADKSLGQKAGSVKRTRIKTQPYQSPLPELEIISKMTSTSTPRSKNNDEKLIIFYKNEFLAVRNSEGSFYICQAVQNIYKSSPKIKIRWLSQDKVDKSGETYTPDFYDYTDFDCILTNLNLVRVDKGKFKLPPSEKERTDSILKRALAVEKGDATPPSLTEEHPDGLDLSLYKEESQLQKRRGKKRKSTSPLKAAKKPVNTKKSPDQPKVKKVIEKPKAKQPVKKMVTRKAPAEIKKPAVSSVVSTPSRSERAKRRQDASTSSSKTSPVVDQKKAKVLAKVARKTVVSTITTKTQATSSKSSEYYLPFLFLF
ncbi:hypothetical protein MML48_7g00009698 [Holotrichia oblita]|uniref:Uncharacterized protein n=1 Tax=Holotrichia oblita TaxID=644536 RepID=A0ACB9SSK5_HOLOL|nr:hypothetical protein MML48_7g00009698 [Holotrichia oblita]